MFTRRNFLAAAAGALPAPLLWRAPRRPNVLLIISDDQGYGDLSFHGNSHLRTPHLDALARESSRFSQFHVSPVCAPTRASLMTGRYNYRTGVVDTYLGRAMMHSDEVTLAELLRDAGYQTGIFGKWHLGDNYPLRACDQGFTESVVHRGGGIGQPSDQPGTGYFDPILSHNGTDRKYSGYCTDVLTAAAMQFIESNRRRPFFAYLATNAPHTPLEVAEHYVAPYRAQGLDDTTARVYGMVANLDENVGRLLRRLQQLNLHRDTIVIFLTDNGPQQPRYNAGMRGLKSTVYQGGIRVPFFLRWPGGTVKPGVAGRVAAHIDLVPTLLEACGIPAPARLSLDGRSLLPLIRDSAAPWSDRNLFFQWHRGDQPEPFRASAVRNQRYKLVNGAELYDLETDPAESNDISAAQPERVTQMRSAYEQWFRDVSATRGYDPPRIHIGAPQENPTVLTRQDWRGPQAGWTETSLGHWEVTVVAAGPFTIRLDFARLNAPGKVRLRFGNVQLEKEAPAGSVDCAFPGVSLPPASGPLHASVVRNGAEAGVQFVELRRDAR